MKRTFTIQNFESFKENALRKGEMTRVYREHETVETYKTQLANVLNRSISLRSGLSVDISELESAYSISISNRHDASFPLTLAFTLAGRTRTLTEGINQNEYYDEVAGESYLFYLPGTQEIEESVAGEYYQTVRLRLDLDILKSFEIEKVTIFPEELQPLFQGNQLPLFHRCVGKITHAMKLALHQILHCPYQGMLQRIYLESKVLELVALQFSQLIEKDSSSLSTVNLHAADIERIYQAREILFYHVHEPPSLVSLARQVGLNERKLKEGFRQVFDNTVFGCLYDYRMQQAQALLLNRDITIAGIAATIGYKSPTSFNAAFRRKFGLSPKAYQLAGLHRNAS